MRRNNRRSRLDSQNEKSARGRKLTAIAHEELKRPITLKGSFQKDLFSSITKNSVTLVNSPAGTGKTFVVMSTVSDWLKQGKIDKIILSRPTVGMGNSLGLLKGGIREKFEPYLAAMVNVLCQRYGNGFYETQLGNKNIEFVPLEYIRGRSFENAVVIVDEFQNTDEQTAYTIMTRVGENSKLICLGDISQNDLGGKETGLDWAIDFIDRHNLFEFADFVEGTSEDIVRGSFCKAVVKAREKDISFNH